MAFDFGELLTGSWKVTWKYKVLWILVMLPALLAVLLLIPLIGFVLYLEGNPSEAAERVFTIALLVFAAIFFVVSIILSSLTQASATLGVVRADRGEGSLAFMDLLRDGTQYFSRILGVILVISLGIGLLFTAFNLCVLALTILTLGLASICLQPLMFLLAPLMFLFVAVMEGAQTAVIAEDLGAMDAVQRAWQVVRDSIWKYVIITLIIYFGSMILSGFLMIPFMMPMFALPFAMDPQAGSSRETVTILAIGFSCIFFPIMLAIQAVVGTFMKVALDLAYLRLRGPAGNAPLLLKEKDA